MIKSKTGMRLRLLIPGLMLLLWIGCSQHKENNTPVVVSVNGSQLTLDELRTTIPENTGVELSKVQVQNYIQRWMENELLHQKALETNIQNQEHIRRRLREMRRDFLVASYLEQTFDTQIEIEDDEIKKFYKRYTAEFIRPETLYDVDLILTADYQTANTAKNAVGDETDFASVALEHSLDESKENGGSLGWITLDEIPPQLAERVPRMREGRIYGPYNTDVGYYVVRVNEVREEGETQTLEEVRDIIVWRLKAAKREEKYRQLINYLHENAEVRINWSIMDSVNVVQ